MVSVIVSMSSSYCSVSNQVLNSSWNSIFFDPSYVASTLGGFLVINVGHRYTFWAFPRPSPPCFLLKHGIYNCVLFWPFLECLLFSLFAHWSVPSLPYNGLVSLRSLFDVVVEAIYVCMMLLLVHIPTLSLVRSALLCGELFLLLWGWCLLLVGWCLP